MKLNITKQNNTNEETIRGFVKKIFYPKTGFDKNIPVQFAGMAIKTNKNVNLSVFGKISPCREGDYFEFTGFFQDDGSFKFSSAIKVDDDILGATSMLGFLFGPKTASMLIEAFGGAQETLKLFKENDALFELEALKIKGIGRKKIDKAYSKYENNIAVDTIFSKFNKYQLSINQSLKIYELFGKESLSKLQENPYILIHFDICTWKIADRIALNYYQLDSHDTRRIEAAIIAEMLSFNSRGHVFAYLNDHEYENLISFVANTLKIDTAFIKDVILNMVKRKKLVLSKDDGKDIVYLPSMYEAEYGFAKYVKKFISNKTVTDAAYNRIQKFIAKYETEKGFNLAQKQKEAITNSLTNVLSIISGPPGSGKTTIIDVICQYYQRNNKSIKIKLCSPTGKAANRMYESTGLPASTIHRMLSYLPQEAKFEHDEHNPIDADVLIIDEISMLGLSLAYHLLKAVPDSIKAIIFVGDKNQLPSVDAGKVLEDMLESKVVPAVVLNEIYRQSKDSTILSKALDYSKGIVPSLEDTNDFKFYEEKNISNIKLGLTNLYIDEVKKYGVENVCVLAPQNISELGINELNPILQEAYNPKKFESTPEIYSGKRIFRLGDRVIQITNEDEYHVYNGMVGTITEVVVGDRQEGIPDSITVSFENVECTYNRDRFDNLKLAYSITVHKSQGGEYASVILLCHGLNRFMLKKRLVYTGMTRAKKILHIIGEKEVFKHSINEVLETPRYTNLQKHLKEDY